MKFSGAILAGKLSNVESDVEIQGIFPRAANFDILQIFAEALRFVQSLDRNFLGAALENFDCDLWSAETVNSQRTQVLIIDQNKVLFQGGQG